MRNFGGMATSRMNRNLRLDKHWSYGTSGGVSTVRGPRMFSVIAPVQTDKTKEAMVEVMKEIRGVAGERPLAGEEFDSIMRSQVGAPARPLRDARCAGRRRHRFRRHRPRAGVLLRLRRQPARTDAGGPGRRRQGVREARRADLDDHRRLEEDRGRRAGVELRRGGADRGGVI